MAKNTSKNKKRTKEFKLPTQEEQDRTLHTRDLCTDPDHHFHLKEHERELTRKLKSFYDAGDSQEELEDTTEYKQLLNSPLRTYERMSEASESIRFTTHAVVQLIETATYATDYQNALLTAFLGTTKTLQFTKKEKKLAKLCYELGQSRLQQQVVKSLFYNEKIGNNMKLLSQIKNYVDDNESAAKGIAASLNISLTDKKEHKRPKPTQEEASQNKNQVKTPPLKLVN